MSPLAPSFLAIIPARAGSKRLPDKNIKPLCGKPLIAWSIESALASPYISEVAISTDSEVYASLARKWGASAPFLRPQSLSSDTSTTFDALKHCIEYYKENLGRSFDYIALLQPTSPLRKSLHINQACEKILAKGASSLISVCECEHSPLWCNTLPDDESMSDFLSPQVLGVRSQDLPRYFRLNGVIFIAKTNALLESQGFFTPHTIAYTMPARYSSDIDSALDFEVAEMILARELGFAVSYTGGGAELSFSASPYLCIATFARDLRAYGARDSRALLDSHLAESHAMIISAHPLDSKSHFSQSPILADSEGLNSESHIITALPKAPLATYLKPAPLTDSTSYKGGAYAA